MAWCRRPQASGRPETFPSRKSERPSPKIIIRRKQPFSFDASRVIGRCTRYCTLAIDHARKQSLLARKPFWNFEEKDIIQLRGPLSASTDTAFFHMPKCLSPRSIRRTKGVLANCQRCCNLSSRAKRSPIPKLSLRRFGFRHAPERH